MILKRALCVLFVMTGLRGVADQPPHASFTSDLYVLRMRVPPRGAGMQGIWRFDPVAGTYVRVAPFFYGGADIPGFGAYLAAFEDRLQVQGTNYLEYDLATMRLLRRYQGAQGVGQLWTFQGTMVTETQASRLGIRPGIYGYPICFPASGATPACALLQLPGYPQPTFNGTRFDLLYRRGIRPEDAGLELWQELPPVGSGTNRRYFSFDERRGRILMWAEGAEGLNNWTAVKRLSAFPLHASGIGPEAILFETKYDSLAVPKEEARVAWAFGYQSSSDSLFHNWEYYRHPRHPFRLTRTSVALAEEQVLDEDSWEEGSAIPLTFATVPTQLPSTYEQVVPVIGNGPGANGTYWRSDIWLYNPSAEPVSFTLRRVGGTATVREQVLAPHASLKIADVHRSLGGGPASIGGDGIVTDALVITSSYRWGQQLVAYSRTFTESAHPDERGGTYGQAVPAVPSRTGYSTHLPAFEEYSEAFYNSESDFVVDRRDPARFRHNLGVVNDTAEPLQVGLRYGATRETERSLTVAPHSVSNVNIESLFSAEVMATRGPRVWITVSKPCPVWMSVIDNLTGDASFVPFSLFAIRSDAETRMAIPATAHTEGANGTFWQTDLYGVFPPNQQPVASFYPSFGCSATSGIQKQLQGIAGPPAPEGLFWSRYWQSIFPDVVRQFGECAGGNVAGALELPIASWMSGYSRTYTTRASDGGTFGEILPFYPAGGWPIQHFSGIEMNSRFRVNLGLYNGLDRTVDHRLVLYDQSGRLVTERNLQLNSKQLLQQPLKEIFPGLPEGLYGLSVIPVDDDRGPGRSWAYVALVDNITSDPTNFW